MKDLRKAAAVFAAAATMAVSMTSMTANAAITENNKSMTRNGATCVDDLSGNIVFFPEEMTSTDATYPIVVWANGTMCNAGMYYGLLESIADNGYIVVTNRDVMAANGKSQIASLDFIINENSDAESLFYGKVDTENVCFAGHSQGGRSAVNAAAADSRCDCVISFAGSNYTYEAEACSAPCFFIGGTLDAVVPTGKWIVPAYNAVKGEAVYASKKNAVHTTCCVSPAGYVGYTVDYLDAYLKGDESAKAVFRKGGKLSKDSGWKSYTSKGI